MRLKWSQVQKDTPYEIILESLKESKFYVNNKFILMTMYIEDNNNFSSMELSVPAYKLLSEIRAMPMDKQKLFLSKTKFIMYKRFKGKIEIKNLQAYDDTNESILLGSMLRR